MDGSNIYARIKHAYHNSCYTPNDKKALNTLPKILLGAPINVRKDYVIDEWLKYVRALTWWNLDVYLVDNSYTDTFAKYVRSKGFEVDRCEPKGRPEKYIAKSQNMIRERFLKGGYDYLFSLECDNFAPLDIIQRLLAHGVDNVNSPYLLGDGNTLTLGVQVIGFKGVGFEKLDVMPPEATVNYIDGTLKGDNQLPSLGCGLYSRRLLELVHFRVQQDMPGTFSDSFFHHDSKRVGVIPYVDTSIISTHKRNNQWSKIGKAE